MVIGLVLVGILPELGLGLVLLVNDWRSGGFIKLINCF